ncbi:MAG: hypothetical protein KGM47_15770 [Acidobacteriota bacterium]|nr:hypothetical protein [Acidobacteriota bacterium]
MSEVKKPHNAANIMFGLDDVAPQKETKPAQSQNTGESATQYGSPLAPTVSFGRSAAPPASQTQASDEARSGSGQPGFSGPAGPSGSAGQARNQEDSGHSRNPQYVYVPAPPPSTAGWTKWLLGIVLVLAVVALLFGLVQRAKFTRLISQQADQINSLTRRADSSDERYAQLSAKFTVTADRLGLTQAELARARQLAVNIEKQQQQSVRQLNAAISEKASASQVSQLASASSQKFGQLSGSIAGTQKDLDSTKEALTGAKGELSGAIARTHSELVALAHRTDRDYFEFHINKGSRQRIGSLQVQLLKTSTKHNLFTVNLYFDDKVSQRKDEAIDEPVFFYMEGAQSALELVVNKLGKNTIAGYVSAPKGFISNASNVLAARPNS